LGFVADILYRQIKQAVLALSGLRQVAGRITDARLATFDACNSEFELAVVGRLANFGNFGSVGARLFARG